jgi:acyl carrier protein
MNSQSNTEHSSPALGGDPHPLFDLNLKWASRTPGDPVEARLLAIWRDLLGTGQVGIRDNFFESGGHSLLAVRLFARIREEFQVDLPLPLIFQYGTVEELARILRADPEASLTSGVFPIQPLGTQTPLFLVSEGLYLRPLAMAFSPSRPVFACQPIEEGKVVYRTSVQETARIFFHNLIACTPEGPYLLLAQSAYGYYALELARILKENGKHVAFLGLPDTFPPGPRRRMRFPNWVQYHRENLRGRNSRQMLTYLADYVRHLVQRRFPAPWPERRIARYEERGEILKERA